MLCVERGGEGGGGGVGRGGGGGGGGAELPRVLHSESSSESQLHTIGMAPSVLCIIYAYWMG